MGHIRRRYAPEELGTPRAWSWTSSSPPHTRSAGPRTLRMLALFVVGALPVAAVLVWLLNPLVALGYVVVQTAFLMFGLRQRHQPRSVGSDRGVQFEPGTFVVRCPWSTMSSGSSASPCRLVRPRRCPRRVGTRMDARSEHPARSHAKGWDRLVPLSDFEDDWRDGQIGQLIREHAPRLLSTPPSDSPISRRYGGTAALTLDVTPDALGVEPAGLGRSARLGGYSTADRDPQGAGELGGEPLAGDGSVAALGSFGVDHDPNDRIRAAR